MISAALLAASVLLSAFGLAPQLRAPHRAPAAGVARIEPRSTEPRNGDAQSPARSSTGAQWAAVLEQMAAEVRTGASIAAAHLAVTGIALRAATERPAAPSDDDEALAIQAIIAARAVGGPVAATLDAAADTIRERVRMRHEARAHSAPARLSATVLTAVPMAFCAWNALTSASFRAALTSPVGLASAALGALCNVTGWWSMRRIIAKALP